MKYLPKLVYLVINEDTGEPYSRKLYHKSANAQAVVTDQNRRLKYFHDNNIVVLPSYKCTANLKVISGTIIWNEDQSETN